jgi:Flp pilus assembly CpaE family ATPase
MAATRPVLDRADHLIVCLSPDRIALVAARRCLEELKESLFSHTQLHVVMCDMNPALSLPRQAVERYLDRPLLAVLSMPRKELIEASNKGIPLGQAFPQSAFMTDLRLMAEQFMAVKKE